jgi:predicted deacylase
MSYDALETRWKALRASHGVAVREVACVGAPRTLLCAEFGDAAQPAIALAAGVHGDEPAGPWALLELVEKRELDPRFAYRIWVCTNPSGYRLGTRENAEGLDVNRTFGRGGQSPEARAILTANRDRKFVLSIDLHEDCDAAGFYCYEYGGSELGSAIVAAMDRAVLPVQPLDAAYDLGAPLAAEHVRFERGHVLPNVSAEGASLGGLSYSLAIVRHATPRALTLESPSALPWVTRLEMHYLAVRAAIATL